MSEKTFDEYKIEQAKSEGRAEAFRACAERCRQVETTGWGERSMRHCRAVASWCDAQAKAQEPQP